MSRGEQRFVAYAALMMLMVIMFATLAAPPSAGKLTNACEDGTTVYRQGGRVVSIGAPCF